MSKFQLAPHSLNPKAPLGKLGTILLRMVEPNRKNPEGQFVVRLPSGTVANAKPSAYGFAFYSVEADHVSA